ncbi:putative bifunctional diguanylate cyclase/phosphodiesterase [Aurantiacibacter gilvus]|uniref:GGDEF domain-containing phosphodiesterase n=1 Tax=Aurantiacibacter gilvus TaxID=3139141 RepID=A0ABU9IE24_9SPHN
MPETEDVERAMSPDTWLGAVIGLAAGLAGAKLAGWTQLPWLVLLFPALSLILAGFLLHRRLAVLLQSARETMRRADAMRTTALTDGLTGLENRVGFRAALGELVEELVEDEQVMLLRIDLRRFHAIKSALGSSNCDKLLVETAKRLRAFGGDDRALARLAAGEFALAGKTRSASAANDLAKEVYDALAGPLRIGGKLIDDGAAIGTALLPAHAATPEDLVEAAELALAQANAGSLRQPLSYDRSMTRARIERREIEDELRGAIMKDELSIYFQPIIDLSTGRIRAFEALVRWFHPERGELVPDQFIPVAEDSGLIITLGNWITARAARAAASWPQDVQLAINLSPVQIRAPGAALGLLNALRDARLDPARLELEVTESLFTEDDPNIAVFMADMGREGVSFSLDDFGMGSSSLHYIHRYPFRAIKVDRSFISGPRIGRESEAIVRAVAEMGATLNMEVVAEGLETIEQVQKAQQTGCTLGQGYYFSRAVPDYLAVMLLSQESQAGARIAV